MTPVAKLRELVAADDKREASGLPELLRSDDARLWLALFDAAKEAEMAIDSYRFPDHSTELTAALTALETTR